MPIKKCIFLLILSVQISASFAFGEALQEGIFKKSIRSVMITRAGWKLSYPIIELKENVKLHLTFDDLSGGVKSYNYKIIHCDFNWEPSPISEPDYIEGFQQNQFNNYSFSFNTSIKYVHYSLDLPNNDVNFLISGNYIIEAFEDNDDRKLIFRKRFIITEKMADIIPSIQRPVLSAFRDNSQEVSFTVNYKSFSIDNPFSDVKIAVLQNGRWDISINDLKPLFDRGGILEYTYQRENLFPGGNEFRWFDIKSMRYKSPYIREVVYKDGAFHVFLFPEEIKSGKTYFYDQDINGKYYVEIQEGKNNELDADYAYVYFTLPYEYPLSGGNFFVMGNFAGNVYSDSNKMKYNQDKKAYELTLPVKQGYYNYRYEFLKDNATAGDPSLTEGNHYETENDYIFLVYYHGNRSRYDRIIGYQIANSLKRK